MKKTELIYRLNLIIEKSTSDNGYTYRAKIREWKNYGKDRTYFSITAARTYDGRIMKEKSYGYLDNETGEYHPERLGDLRKNYTFGGMNFPEATEQEEPDTTPTETNVTVPAEETTHRASELIKKYEISLSNDGILRGNVVQAEKDNVLDEIKSRKAEIIARLEETKAAEERAAAERAAKIAAIEGLEEIKRARAEAEANRSNYELAAIGRKAREAIIDHPENHEAIMAEMDAEISAYVDRHLMMD